MSRITDPVRLFFLIIFLLSVCLIRDYFLSMKLPCAFIYFWSRARLGIHRVWKIWWGSMVWPNFAIFSIFWFKVWLLAKNKLYFQYFELLGLTPCKIIWIFWFKVWILAKNMLYFQYFELWGLTPCKIYALFSIFWALRFDSLQKDLNILT